MDRRDFLVKGSAASLLACFPASLSGIERTVQAGRLERRALGRTGERLSILGFGGKHRTKHRFACRTGQR